MSITIEIAAGNLESVIAAAEGGADRIELCSALSAGGLTPTAGFALEARSVTRLPIYAMIRPREGDFVYTDAEFNSMIHDIRILKETGVDGFVFGALLANGLVDEVNCKTVLSVCHPLPVTFHRAFDRASHPMDALESIISLGFKRLLTSGQADSAWEGREVIKELVHRADGRLSVMAGAGVTEDHAAELVRTTGVTEVHLSAKLKRLRPGSPLPVLREDLTDYVTDAGLIRSLKRSLT